MAEVIQKSSNVGTVKLAMQMRPREMWELFAQLGIGQKPQIDFPGAVTGRLRPYKTWRPIEQATMSYGYGLSVSLFQLARAYTVFAHDGELLPTSILRHEQPAAGVRVLSAADRPAVREMLQMAAGPGGTAPKAQTLGYSVGGKTGTAHKQEGRCLRFQQVPRLVRRHGADPRPAHRRRRHGRRAEQGRVLRWRGGCAGVQPGGAADAAHDGCAAGLEVTPQIVTDGAAAAERESF